MKQTQVNNSVDDQAVRWNFDLSRNKSLRTLETTANSMVDTDTAPSFLSTVLSTIASPLPLDVVIVYEDSDVDRMVYYWSKPFFVKYLHPVERAANVQHHQRRFKMFREMYMARKFRLVLCVDGVDCVTELEDATRVLESIVKVEKAKGGLDYFPYEPLIVAEIRSPRTRRNDYPVAWGVRGIPNSAL